MRGQDTLIALRRRGIRPAKGVLLEVAERDICGNSTYQPHLDDGTVCLWCKPGERHLDLRCVIGLKAVVYGPREVTEDALRAVAEQCEAAGAKRVIAIEYGDVLCRDVYPEIGEWRERGRDG